MPVREDEFEIRVRSSKGYSRYFSLTLSKTKGIRAFFGVHGDKDGIGPSGGKTRILTYIFKKSKWTRAEAQSWVKRKMSKDTVFELKNLRKYRKPVRSPYPVTPSGCY